MRLLVCGGRDWDRIGAMVCALEKLRPSLVIHGGADGADHVADVAAAALGIPVEVYPADWARYGRRAGPIRNAQMLADDEPDAVLAFPGGRGTADMARQAKRAGVPVWEWQP